MSVSRKLMSVQKADDAVYSADLTNASPDNVSLDLSTNNITAPRGLAFNSDGSELVVVCSATDKFHTYSLSNNYLLTGTVTYLGTSRTLSTSRANPMGMCFGKNGTRLYNTDGADRILEYHIPSSDAYDVSQATYQGTSEELNISTWEANPGGLRLSPDGTSVFFTGNSGDRVTEFSLSAYNGVAWDISTAVNTNRTISMSSYDTAISDIEFNSNGTKAYVLGRQNDKVYQFSLSTPYQLSQSYDSISYSPPSSVNDGNWEGIIFNPTYTKMFLVGRTEDKVQQFSCD